jgi:hypothetical protein
MKCKTIVLVSILATGLINAGNANAITYFTAGKMLSLCESDSTEDTHKCMMFLAGIHDAHEALINWKLLKDRNHCIPENVTTQQLLKVYIKYAADYPEVHHLSASSATLRIYNEAFPCK